MKPGRAAYLTSVAAVYVFLMLPISIVVIASFNSGKYLRFPPEGFSLRWYAQFFASQPFMDALELSLVLAAVSTLAATLIGTPAALYYVRHAKNWRETFRLYTLAPLLLPEILTSIALLFLYYQIGLGTKTVAGLYFGHIVICVPFVFLQVTASLYNLSPAVEEAARSLGASPATVFRRITLPLIKPGIINGALFAFIISFDNVTISLLLKGVGTTTLPMQVFDYLRWDFDPTTAAASTVSILMTLGAVLAVDRLVGLRAMRY
ncbi:MAG: ABC transporter permease [Alphaproteobacteria bacterium]|nr:ABC transporter permease [Alphaproteobacteria bacterium]